MKEIYGFVGELGAGKTYHALEKIRKLKSDGKSVLMTSWADPLKTILGEEFGLYKSGPFGKQYDAFRNMNPHRFLLLIKRSILSTVEELKLNIPEEDYELLYTNISNNRNNLILIKDKICDSTENYNNNFRSLIQLFGTEIGRGFYGNIWVEATIKKIKDIFNNKLASCVVVDDIRFMNEYDALINLKSKELYDVDIYGVKSGKSTRARRLNINEDEIAKFSLHPSEKYVPKIISLLDQEHIINN